MKTWIQALGQALWPGVVESGAGAGSIAAGPGIEVRQDRRDIE